MVLLVRDCRLRCRHYCRRQLVARIPGPIFVAVLLVAMPGWPWATSPRSGELIILCWATGTTGLLIIVRYQSRPGVWLKRMSRSSLNFGGESRCDQAAITGSLCRAALTVSAVTWRSRA
jgi:hypothetical protein